MASVIKTKSPDSHDGLALVGKISRAVGNVHGVYQIKPVVGDIVDQSIGGLPANIIHDGKYPSRGFCSCADICRNLISERKELRTGKVGQEALEKHAVQLIFPHPLKMTEDRFLHGG